MKNIAAKPIHATALEPIALEKSELPARGITFAAHIGTALLAAGLLAGPEAEAQSKISKPATPPPAQKPQSQPVKSSPPVYTPSTSNNSPSAQQKGGKAATDKPTLGSVPVRARRSREEVAATVRMAANAIYATVAPELDKLTHPSQIADAQVIHEGIKLLHRTSDADTRATIYRALTNLLSHSEDFSPSKFNQKGLKSSAETIRKVINTQMAE